jgi:hypothetical protein
MKPFQSQLTSVVAIPHDRKTGFRKEGPWEILGEVPSFEIAQAIVEACYQTAETWPALTEIEYVSFCYCVGYYAD